MPDAIVFATIVEHTPRSVMAGVETQSSGSAYHQALSAGEAENFEVRRQRDRRGLHACDAVFTRWIWDSQQFDVPMRAGGNHGSAC